MNYNEQSIKTLDSLAHMRLRLNSYVRDTSAGGQFHIIKEAIDNGVDEISLMDGSGCLEVLFFRNKRIGTYQVVVIDNGRGMPLGKMLDILLVGNTSGKFDQENYIISTGSNGCGIKTTLAASKDFRAISFNGKLVGDTGLFNHTCTPKRLIKSKNVRNNKGTIVFLTPDPAVLHEIIDFTNDPHLLEEHIAQLSLFANYRIKFFIIEELISDRMLNEDTDVFIQFIKARCNYKPYFDSATFNKEQYVANFFKLTRPFLVSHDFSYRNTTDAYLAIDLKLSVLPTKNVNNNRLTFVNNILFTDRTCFQYTELIAYLKGKMIKHIQDPAIHNFFKEHYTLPIWVFGNISFSGAVFVGLEKSAYRDDAFKKPYKKALHAMLSEAYVTELYNILAAHIETCYNNFSNKHLKVSNNKSLLTQLNYPTKFTDCRAVDRSITELFLVEGDSAKSDKARNPEFQASYALRGKPINGVLTKDKMSISKEKLKANQIFQDVIKILNIQDGTMDNLYFNKLFIATDADAHGYHIANIVLGNLFVLCPEFVNSGKIYLSMPPHYRINLGKNKAIFARTTSELNAILSKYVYSNYLELRLQSDLFDKALTIEEYMAFNEIVDLIGDTITSIGEEYFIHPVILEQLALLTNKIDFNNPDTSILSEAFGQDVKFNAATNVLTVSIGTKDIVIPLIKMTEIIYEHILPLYRSFHYNRTTILATTKKTKLMHNQPISVVQLYQIHKQLMKTVPINPLKGLGTMSPPEIYQTCINPEHRRCQQITSLGDIETIFQMLGSDNKWRKQLVLSGYEGVM